MSLVKGYDSNAAVGGNFIVNTYTTNHQNFSEIAMNASGDFIITWDSELQDGSGSGIFAQRFDNTGNPVGTEFQVNTYITGVQRHQVVSMDNSGSFIVAWSDYSGLDGDVQGVFARRYDNTGMAFGTEFQVNTYTSNLQVRPDIAIASNGNFVITWESSGGINPQDGQGSGIFAQRYNSDGSPLGSEFQVNTVTTSSQEFPEIAMDGSGNFTIVWDGPDGNGDGVFGQRFDNNGNPVGSEFMVNTTTNRAQDEQAIAMAADGRFVVTWTNNSQFGMSLVDEVFGQRFNSDGSMNGAEFQVSTATSRNQNESSVAMDSDGHYVVSWINRYVIGMSPIYYSVSSQRYTSDGMAL